MRLGESVTPERLALYLDDLGDLSHEQIERALWRARRELKFFPKIAELRELAGADPEQSQAAAAHKAWDVVVDFTDKWVHADVQGCYVPQQGCRSCPPPRLEQRMVDCVRRLGGWKRLKTASEDDVPFLKRDFIEEYTRWEAVESIDISHMLSATAPMLQLKAMEAPMQVAAPSQSRSPVRRRGLNVEPLTPSQIADRREMLRQQAELMRTKYAKPSAHEISVRV